MRYSQYDVLCYCHRLFLVHQPSQDNRSLILCTCIQCLDTTAPCTEATRLTVNHICAGKPKHDVKPAHEHKGHYGHTKPPKIPWVKNPKPVHEHKGHYGKPKHAKGHYGHAKPVKHEHAKPVKHEHKGHYGEPKPAFCSSPLLGAVRLCTSYFPNTRQLQPYTCWQPLDKELLTQALTDPPECLRRQAQARPEAGARAQGPLRPHQAAEDPVGEEPQAGARAQGPLWYAPSTCSPHVHSTCLHTLHGGVGVESGS